MKLRMILIAFLMAMISPALAGFPEGFQRQEIIGTNLNEPTGFEFAPDGRVFITEKGGAVKIYKNGQLLSQPFVKISVNTDVERGLMGIAFDPQFNENHDVYFYYISSDNRYRIARYDASGDTAKDGPVIIYEADNSANGFHHGGTIRFGPDGKLYLAFGDNTYSPNGQDRSNVHGSMIRINKDGSIPGDNPFVGQSGVDPEIWAYGLRNPFRFQFDPATGQLYLGDVGHNDWEEVNKIVKGGNYGWPVCEGFCDKGYINPLHAYDHTYQGQYISSSITGGPVYRGTMFPDEYRGAYFFGDYARQWIRYMKLDSNGNNAGVFFFADNVDRVIDMKVASDGSLWYLSIFPGKLYRVSYDDGNAAPQVKASADKTQGNPPLTVQFSSSGTFDPDGDSLSYRWDFGDGTSSTSANPSKTYHNKGRFTVTLTASDGKESTKSSPIFIQVGTPPSITVHAPNDGSLYRAGDTISYGASARDSDGSSADVDTTVIFHHADHIHPFLGPLESSSGTFQIPRTGETSADTWFEVKYTATDRNGLVSEKSVFIFPRKSTLTFLTNPSEMQVVINGQPKSVPHSVEAVENFIWEIGTWYLQYPKSQTHVFDRWSDGGDRFHEISVPQSDTSYTAFFERVDESAFRGEYFNNMFLSGSPDLVRNDPFIDFNWGEFSPDSKISGETFSARWTKDQHFDEGTYTFRVVADDGLRLKIDGNMVIDKWIDQPATEYAADVFLTTGTHKIVLEYYENTGDAEIELKWRGKETHFDSHYYMSPNINEDWVEVNVQPSDGRSVRQAYVRIWQDQWLPLEKAEWGNWVLNRHVPSGAEVEFLAMDNNGVLSQSSIINWMSHTSAGPVFLASFPAQFYLSPNINNNWAEVNVESPYDIVKVEMEVNGVFTTLEKKSWGNWATSTHIPSGKIVQFRAWSSEGKYAWSWEYRWP